MRCLVFALALLPLLVTGCGRIPEPVGYTFSEQQKMQASHHWDVLAADIANEINNELIRSDYINSPVFVRETCGDENTPCEPFQTTVFNETFRDLLITQLVNLGVPTSSNEYENAIIVNYKAQTVYRHRGRPLALKPGLLTAVTAGIVVLRHAPAEIIALVSAGAIDFINASYASISNFEVVITTSLIAKNNYLYRNSNIYYINDQDSWHYQMSAKPAEIKLTAGFLPPDTQETTGNSSRIEQPEPIFPVDTKKDSTGI